MANVWLKYSCDRDMLMVWDDHLVSQSNRQKEWLYEHQSLYKYKMYWHDICYFHDEIYYANVSCIYANSDAYNNFWFIWFFVICKLNLIKSANDCIGIIIMLINKLVNLHLFVHACHKKFSLIIFIYLFYILIIMILFLDCIIASMRTKLLICTKCWVFFFF